MPELITEIPMSPTHDVLGQLHIRDKVVFKFEDKTKWSWKQTHLKQQGYTATECELFQDIFLK